MTQANSIDFDVFLTMFGEPVVVTDCDGVAKPAPTSGIVYVHTGPGPDGRVRIRSTTLDVAASTPLEKGDIVTVRGHEYQVNVVEPRTDQNSLTCTLARHAA